MGWHIPSCWLCPSPLYVQGCWGAVLPGGCGVLAPLQAARAGAGRSRRRQSEAGAARRSQSQLSHCRSQALCADGCPSAPGLCNWSATHPPDPPLPHTCSCTVFSSGTVLGAARSLQHPLSPGVGAAVEPRPGLALFWAPSQHVELGNGDAWSLVHLTVGAGALT